MHVSCLQALLNERHGLLALTSVNNPVIMHKLMTSKLVDPPVPDHQPPGPVFWQRILVSALTFLSGLPSFTTCWIEMGVRRLLA